MHKTSSDPSLHLMSELSLLLLVASGRHSPKPAARRFLCHKGHSPEGSPCRCPLSNPRPPPACAHVGLLLPLHSCHQLYFQNLSLVSSCARSKYSGNSETRIQANSSTAIALRHMKVYECPLQMELSGVRPEASPNLGRKSIL